MAVYSNTSSADKNGAQLAAMRYQSKQALLDDIRTEHASLCARLQEIPKARWHEPGLWGEGWTLSDLVAHLAEWQHMFLSWYKEGLLGAVPQTPAPGYGWNETPALNRAIREKHRSRSQSAVRADFDAGHRQIVQIVEALSSEQLLEPGHYEWTGKHALTTYIGPNTASHYRFAIKILKRWLKGTAEAHTSGARPNKRLQLTKARTGAAHRQGKRPRLRG